MGGTHCSGVEFSHLLTNCICSPNTNFNTFFSAPSFYPGREINVPLARLSNVISDLDQLSDIDDGETEVESESDWLANPQPSGSGPRLSSLEVRFQHPFFISDLSFFCSNLHGRMMKSQCLSALPWVFRCKLMTSPLPLMMLRTDAARASGLLTGTAD